MRILQDIGLVLVVTLVLALAVVGFILYYPIGVVANVCRMQSMRQSCRT